MERWFRNTDTPLASVDVITLMRRWGNPSVFPSVVCLCVPHMCLCVCLRERVSVYDHTPECVLYQRHQWVGAFAVFMCGYCVWTEWSLYPRHVVNSLLSDSLLPASAVYLCSLQEVWLTTAQVTHPELTGFDQIWPHLPKINQRPQDRSETTTQPTANITYHDVAVAVFCTNLRLRPPSSGFVQRWPLLYWSV